MASPWYRDGLRFTCTRCGNCCGGASGTVRVSDAELETLAARLGLAPDEFRAAYTRQIHRRGTSLRERRDGTCVLYDPRGGCTVYADRPRQCRTWPYWSSVVHTAERWAEESEGCPAMGRGELHDARHVEQLARDDGTFGGGS